MIKGLDYETSRRLRDVSKAHREHWESIKYQCFYCRENVSRCLRFTEAGRVFHLSCKHTAATLIYLKVYGGDFIEYYSDGLTISRDKNGWYYNLDDGFIENSKEAEELYQKFLKWNN